MDINFLRALATLFVFVTFLGVCITVYRPSKKAGMEDAGLLPFADESLNAQSLHLIDMQKTNKKTGVK